MKLRLCVFLLALFPLAVPALADGVGEVDHGLAERRIDFVCSAIRNKGTIQFELFEWQFIDFGKRRIGATEIVDRKPHIIRLQFLTQFTGEGEIADNLFLRNVDDQSRPFLIGWMMSLDDVHDGELHQCRHWNIHREAKIDPELGKVRAGLQREFAKLHSRRFGGVGGECPRENKAVLGMTHAGVSLRARQLLLAHRNFRLVPELDPLATLACATQESLLTMRTQFSWRV